MSRKPTGLLCSRFPSFLCLISGALLTAGCAAGDSAKVDEGSETDEENEVSGGSSGLGGSANGCDGGGRETGGGGGPGGAGGGPSGGGGAGGMAGAASAGGVGGAEEPKVARVPMFVAVGRGGRRVMSCDRGRTWIADKQVASGSEDNEHRTYTPKGLAYGGGTFVFLTGWGTDSTTWVSKNGIDWIEQKQQDPFGGVGFDDGQFILVGNRLLVGSQDLGATWSPSNVAKPAYDRDAAAFTGIWAAGNDGKVVTRRKGGVWAALSGCVGQRHGGIGGSGGFAAGFGVMISVGDAGDTCGIAIATGEALAAGKISASVRGKPAFVGDAFWVATGDSIYSSSNGITWTGRPLPMEVRFELVARDASGTYAGVSQSGDSFFFSDDGQRWTKARAPTGNGLVNIVAGAGLPSAQCPLP